MYIDPDGRQHTKRTDQATNILRCNKRCKGQAQKISPHVFTIIKEHACPLPTEAPDIKSSVHAKAKEVLQADKKKKARDVILALLKAAELECPGASLPKPDNVVRTERYQMVQDPSRYQRIPMSTHWILMLTTLALNLDFSRTTFGSDSQLKPAYYFSRHFLC